MAGAAPRSRLPAGACSGTGAVPAPAQDGAEPAGTARGCGASHVPRPCRSHGVTSPRLWRSDGWCPELSTPLPRSRFGIPGCVCAREGNMPSGRGGPAGTSLHRTCLLSSWTSTGPASMAQDQRSQAECSQSAGCVWSACSGGFLNKNANGHGAEGARNHSNSRAWGRSTPATV